MPSISGIGGNNTQPIVQSDVTNSTSSPFWNAAMEAITNSAEQVLTAGVRIQETPDHGVITTRSTTTTRAANGTNTGPGGVGGSGLSVAEVVGIGVGIGLGLLLLGGALCCYCRSGASHRGDKTTKHEPRTSGAGAATVGNVEGGHRDTETQFINDGRKPRGVASHRSYKDEGTAVNDLQMRVYNDRATHHHDSRDQMVGNHRTSHTSHTSRTYTSRKNHASGFETRSIGSDDGVLRASSLQFEPPTRFQKIDETGYRTTGHTKSAQRARLAK